MKSVCLPASPPTWEMDVCVWEAAYLLPGRCITYSIYLELVSWCLYLFSLGCFAENAAKTEGSRLPARWGLPFAERWAENGKRIKSCDLGFWCRRLPQIPHGPECCHGLVRAQQAEKKGGDGLWAEWREGWGTGRMKVWGGTVTAGVFLGRREVPLLQV